MSKPKTSKKPAVAKSPKVAKPEIDVSPVSSMDIHLSEDVLAKLRMQVGFETEEDVRQLVSDALNSYIQVGKLVASGGEIFAQNGAGGQKVRLKFPFDVKPD